MGMKVNGTSGLTFPDTTTLASAGQASVRAWVNFNGTGTVAIRAGYNVTSITDNGTGDYTVNFTTALPDINFSINGTCSSTSAGNNCPTVFDNSPVRARTTTSSSIRTMDTGNFGDVVWANIAIFR